MMHRGEVRECWFLAITLGGEPRAQTHRQTSIQDPTGLWSPKRGMIKPWAAAHTPGLRSGEDILTPVASLLQGDLSAAQHLAHRRPVESTQPLRPR